MKKIILTGLILAVIFASGCVHQTVSLVLTDDDFKAFTVYWDPNLTLQCKDCLEEGKCLTSLWRFNALIKVPEDYKRHNPSLGCKLFYQDKMYPEEVNALYALEPETIGAPGGFNVNVKEDNEITLCCGIEGQDWEQTYKQACKTAILKAKCDK